MTVQARSNAFVFEAVKASYIFFPLSILSYGLINLKEYHGPSYVKEPKENNTEAYIIRQEIV